MRKRYLYIFAAGQAFQIAATSMRIRHVIERELSKLSDYRRKLREP